MPTRFIYSKASRYYCSIVACIVCICLLQASRTHAQSVFIGFQAGLANYQGELQQKRVDFNLLRPAVGINATYRFNENWALRAGFLYGSLRAADSLNDPSSRIRTRNLDFQTRYWEASLSVRYRITQIDLGPLVPFALIGAGILHVNPYTYDAAGEKWYLYPLGTEGQGLAAYPNRQMNKPLSLVLPIGGGVQWAVTPRLNLEFTFVWHKAFTDYIDDVSTTYADPAVLLAGRGPKAVELAYRYDEVPGATSAYTRGGGIRGYADQDDAFYHGSIGIQYEIFGRGMASRKRLRNLSCPKF